MHKFHMTLDRLIYKIKDMLTKENKFPNVYNSVSMSEQLFLQINISEKHRREQLVLVLCKAVKLLTLSHSLLVPKAVSVSL